ncbi:histone deacetylase [Pseudoalteromonas shioyasakiensis]|uniref:histone deacetylase family protein n=1 Tax=Pseudoalteromonas shioyasakiensis TaxID=1190813 RepID=UPI001EFCF79F|nr:histone deacetylase [Pseudoalteromonas shioyasakiensis]
MMFYYHPSYSALTLPERHRFPIDKYRLLKQLVSNFIDEQHFITPQQATKAQLTLCHNPDYVDAFLTGSLDSKAIKKMGFPWSTQLVERTLYSVGASIQGAEFALQQGAAFNLSGGYHHAFTSYGSGFCIFNDLAIAAAHLIDTEQADTVLIFDCDVHQGDGTAEVTKVHPQIISCSIHCQQNFPRIKQQSNYDFALEHGTSDTEYLETVKQALALTIRLHQPDIILYNAGADIASDDELGHFQVSLEGVYQRDHFVLSQAKQAEIPVFAAMGGGYQRNVSRLVDVHGQLFRAAVDLF